MILLLLMEECNELSQIVSKALRFGMDEKHPEMKGTNVERIQEEFIDVVAIYNLCVKEGFIPRIGPAEMEDRELNKQIKVQRYLGYSSQCGTITEDQSAEIERLRTLLVAGAEELAEHWDKHTDVEGYGPQNLLLRMEQRLKGFYPGYSPGEWKKLKDKNEQLRILLETERLRSGYHN